MASVRERLEAIVSPAIEAVGCELWGLDYAPQSKRALLRIYIEKSGGVRIDDCEAVSRQVSSVLDVEDPIKSEYVLEVSSPGMDRRLYTLPQYAQYAGNSIALRLRVAFEGRRKYNGLLKGVEGDEVVLQVADEEYLLPFELIERANVVPVVEKPAKKKAGGKKGKASDKETVSEKDASDQR